MPPVSKPPPPKPRTAGAPLKPRRSPNISEKMPPMSTNDFVAARAFVLAAAAARLVAIEAARRHFLAVPSISPASKRRRFSGSERMSLAWPMSLNGFGRLVTGIEVRVMFLGEAYGAALPDVVLGGGPRHAQDGMRICHGPTDVEWWNLTSPSKAQHRLGDDVALDLVGAGIDRRGAVVEIKRHGGDPPLRRHRRLGCGRACALRARAARHTRRAPRHRDGRASAGSRCRGSSWPRRPRPGSCRG